MSQEFHAHFSTSVDDPGAFIEMQRPTLAAAKKCCEDRRDEDAFGMPRVYVRETVRHEEDDLHLASETKEDVGFYEFDNGDWVYHPISS